tara:strand:- start:471 stop:1763 length:1293 start_codon:yes stop_codon:yes gene_type:complete
VEASTLPPPATTPQSSSAPETTAVAGSLVNLGWNEEREFQSWKTRFELEMEERLVRAHKDFNESAQHGLNTVVSLLSAAVTLLGTVSLILFSSSDDGSLQLPSNATAEGRTQRKRNGKSCYSSDTVAYSSLRWWFDIMMTLTSLLATGVSNFAGRRAARIAELLKKCDAYSDSRLELIELYRKQLDTPVDGSSPRKAFPEFKKKAVEIHNAEILARDEHFVARTLSNQEKMWALVNLRLYDAPAFNRYFHYCVICPLRLRIKPSGGHSARGTPAPDSRVSALSTRPHCRASQTPRVPKAGAQVTFSILPVVQQYEFPKDRQKATMLLYYYFSSEQMCAHLRDEELKMGRDGKLSAMMQLRSHYRKPATDGKSDGVDINMDVVRKELGEWAKANRRGGWKFTCDCGYGTNVATTFANHQAKCPAHQGVIKV